MRPAVLPSASKERWTAKVGFDRVEPVSTTQTRRRRQIMRRVLIDDLSGNYVAVGAGATVAGGADVTVMRNQNGVVVELQSTTQGASLKFAAEGLHLTLAK